MSAAVLCGSKRSFLEELPPSPSQSYLSKRLRFSSSTSHDESTIQHIWLPYVLSQLRSLFPNMDPQLLEKSLQESGYDFEATVKRLYDLAEKHKEFSSSAPNVDQQLPVDGAGWIDLAIGEMSSATSVDDARARAAKVLEGFKKSTSERVSAQIAERNCQKEEENMMLKKQKEALLEDNFFLKSFVHAQNERCKDYDGRDQELKNLKELVDQQKEQLKKLEMHKYGMQLQLTETFNNNCSNLPAGRFNPDVF